MKIKDLNESKINYNYPRPGDEYDEVEHQLTALVYAKLKSKEDTTPEWVKEALRKLSHKETFIKAVASGKKQNYKPSLNIQNYDNSIAGIGSEKLERVKSQCYGKQITLQIVLNYNNEYWLLAGNTRLSYITTVLKQVCQILVVDVKPFL